MMFNYSVRVCNKEKYWRIILHAPGCAIPETSINQGQYWLTKFCSMFADFSNKWTKSMPVQKLPNRQRGYLTHHTHHTKVLGNIRHRLRIWVQCDATSDLPWQLQKILGWYYTHKYATTPNISDQDIFHRSHLRMWTSKWKTLHVTNIITRAWYPIRVFRIHKGLFNGIPSHRGCREIQARSRIPQVCHPGGLHQGLPMGIHR